MEIHAVITTDGNRLAVRANRGDSLAEILRERHPIDLPCAGKGKCLRCRIRAQGALSEPTRDERAALSAEELGQGVRLACIARALGDVQLWPTADRYEQICDGGVVAEYEWDPLYRSCGIAADIGTTTLCARLYRDGELLGGCSMKNPQTEYGADVISRIGSALEGGAQRLADSVRTALAGLVSQLLQGAGLGDGCVDAAVLTGNTAMLYLLTGQGPEPLAHAPFLADRLFGEFLPAAPLLPGAPLAEAAQVYLPRCVSAFVGADITTALLASGMCSRQESALLIDIGTNGEIALWHRGELFTCSTAAGPAFEGVGLDCGVYGVHGAVDRIWCEEGAARFTTIGGGRAVGICGSGAVDAVAAMLETGVIDETGAFAQSDRFPLAEGVFVSAGDVRRIQLAKSAVRAGMETLLQTAGAGWEDLTALYIAGGFGSYLHLPSAAALGLLPGQMLGRTRVIGNAALSGASMLLGSGKLLATSQALAVAAKTVALDTNPVFLEQYVDCMLFA